MKIWAWLGIVSICLLAFKFTYDAIYDAGYNKRNTEIRDDAIIAQNEAIEKGITDWISLQPEAEKEIIIEERIVEKTRVIEKEIPKVVEKIITVTPECHDLGDDFAELLNKQIRASNGGEGSFAEVSSELVAGVSGTDGIR